MRAELLVLLLLLLACGGPHAQVTTDGSLGAAVTLTGPDVRIPAELGTSAGANLFHSFGQFSVGDGQSATFTGPASVERIIARVSGGVESRIDGLLGSEIVGADVFLLNPAGIRFGADARLDLGGSLYLSSADYLAFADGGRFSVADSAPSTLSLAAPSAFGFVADEAGRVSLSSSALDSGDLFGVPGLVLPFGEDLVVVAGRIDVASGLVARDGRLRLQAGEPGSQIPVSASDGLVATPAGSIVIGTTTLDVGGSTGGEILVSARDVSIADSIIGSFSLADQAAGAVVIRAGRLRVDNSTIGTLALGNASGGRIELRADEASLRTGTAIRASTGVDSVGRAGDIEVEVGTLLMDSDASIESRAGGQGRGGDVWIRAQHLQLGGPLPGDGGAVIAVATQSAGDGGNLDIQADQIDLYPDSGLLASTFGSGRGGTLSIDAERLRLIGNGESIGPLVDASVFIGAAGRGGDVRIVADRVELTGGGLISAVTGGSGDAGNLSIEAGTLSLDNRGQDFPARVTGNVLPGAAGHGARISVTAGELEILGTSEIQASTAGPGDGGRIDIDAATLTIVGERADAFTGIRSETSGSGRAGDVRLQVQRVDIRDRGQVSTTSFSDARGGDLTVLADSIRLRGLTNGEFSFTGLAAQTRGGSGDAGQLYVEADTIEVLSGAEISAATFTTGRGGDLSVRADDILLSGAGSGVLTGLLAQTENRTGQAGNIDLQVERLVLGPGGRVTSASFGPGSAGDLSVRAGSIVADAQGSGLFTGLESSAPSPVSGAAGDLRVEAERIDLAGGAVFSTLTVSEATGGTMAVTANRIDLRSGAQLNATTAGSGRGGDLGIVAGELNLDGSSDDAGVTVIATAALGPGLGGDIDIRADDLRITGRGPDSFEAGIFSTAGGADSLGAGDIRIQVGELQVLGDSAINSATLGRGPGGDIEVRAREIRLAGIEADDFGVGIVANALSPDSASAGNIRLVAEQLWLNNGAEVSTASQGGRGGNIVIDGDGLVTLVNGRIVTSVVAGAEDAGNVSIARPAAVTVLGVGAIQANAFEGAGGNLTIRTDSVLRGPRSRIEASSRLGIDGLVEIDSPDVDVSAGATLSGGEFLDRSDLIAENCGEARDEQRSRLVIDPRLGR